MHPVVKEMLLDMSNSLICAAVRCCFNSDTRCYYINDIYATYIQLWGRARLTASDKFKESFLESYYVPYKQPEDCGPWLVNMLNGYRLSNHQGEQLLINPATGVTCRLVNEVEREAAQFVIATLGLAKTATLCTSSVEGQYLHMLLESECYCSYSDDGPTFDTAPGCLKLT